jgi:hypothetical protein
MSLRAKFSIIGAVIVVILFLVFGFFAPVKQQAETDQEPYNEQEAYTEQEPYETTETYTEKEPYGDTEYYTDYVPYTYTVVCGQDCRPGPIPREEDFGPPGRHPRPRPHCVPRYCTKQGLQAVTQSRTVTKYRDVTKTRTVTKYREVTKYRTVTKYRPTVHYKLVPIFSCSPPPQ